MTVGSSVNVSVLANDNGLAGLIPGVNFIATIPSTAVAVSNTVANPNFFSSVPGFPNLAALDLSPTGWLFFKPSVWSLQPGTAMTVNYQLTRIPDNGQVLSAMVRFNIQAPELSKPPSPPPPPPPLPPG